MSIKKQLKALQKRLPKGGRLFVLFEGEQVSPSFPRHPGDLSFILVNLWRPEGVPFYEGVEVIPGYQRPVNWLAIEARESRQPERIEVRDVP